MFDFLDVFKNTRAEFTSRLNYGPEFGRVDTYNMNPCGRCGASGAQGCVESGVLIGYTHAERA